jgi:hypothetical protein
VAKAALASGMVILMVVLVVVAAVAVFFVLSTGLTGSTSTASTRSNSYVVTSDPSRYFPSGYDSVQVNFSSIRNGDVLTVGVTPVRYYVPSNLETRTTTVSSTATTITVTADYQCGTSMGQRRFFEARLANGDDFQLDYCLVLNTAIAQGAYKSGVPQSWSLWEVSMGTTPIVAIHLAGNGETVNATELWGSK